MKLANSVVVASLAISCATVRPAPKPALPIPPPPPAAAPVAPVVPVAPYVTRGHQVEGIYQAYAAVYQRMYDQLFAALKAEGLEHELEAKVRPPTPMKVGYGLLPKLLDEVPPAPSSPKPQSLTTPFSWKINEGVIAYQLKLVNDALHRIANLPPDPAARVTELKALATKYQELQRGKVIAESQIQYNWLWQNEIARDKPRFDRMTELVDKVIQRQHLRDANGEVDPQQRDLDAQLARDVAVARNEMNVPPFLKFSHPDTHHWLITTLLVTDIEARDAVEAFRKVIEDHWRVVDGDDLFELKLRVVFISPEKLYAPAEPPALGDAVDLDKHLAHFPPIGGILTTGAGSLHALVGRAVFLPASEIAPNVLAHEFGHLLGFPDRYFRGYRDHGPEGYEILEAVPDLDDIMSAPGRGKVQRIHFERLFEFAPSAPALGH